MAQPAARRYAGRGRLLRGSGEPGQAPGEGRRPSAGPAARLSQLGPRALAGPRSAAGHRPRGAGGDGQQRPGGRRAAPPGRAERPADGRGACGRGVLGCGARQSCDRARRANPPGGWPVPRRVYGETQSAHRRRPAAPAVPRRPRRPLPDDGPGPVGPQVPGQFRGPDADEASGQNGGRAVRTGRSERGIPTRRRAGSRRNSPTGAPASLGGDRRAAAGGGVPSGRSATQRRRVDDPRVARGSRTDRVRPGTAHRAPPRAADERRGEGDGGGSLGRSPGGRGR